MVGREETGQLLPRERVNGMLEERAHAAADDLGVPEVHGPRQRDGRRYAERGGGAHHSPHVPRILKGIEHEVPCRAGRRDQRRTRDDRHREHPLRRVGIGSAVELLFSHHAHGYSPLLRRFEQPRPARVSNECVGSEEPRDFQWRGEQRLDRTHPFGDEAVLAFTGFAPLQVTGECE